MKLSTLDRDAGYSEGAGPLALCLQRLNTLLHSPAVAWDDAQRTAAAADLSAALKVMNADVLTLAGVVHTRMQPQTRAEYVVPVNGDTGEADWDSLVKGRRGPWSLDGTGGWAWRPVMVWDAPRLQAIDEPCGALATSEAGV